MKQLILSLVATLHFFVVFGLSGPAFAEERPVTIMIPFGPGGAVDIAAHILADFWQEKYGQQTTIQCMAGGAGNLAIMAFNEARPDGYSMLFISASTYAAGAQLMLGPEGMKTITPIGQASVMWLALAVNSASCVNSVDKLFEHVREDKGKVSYGSHGPLSPQRLFMLRLVRSIAPDMENLMNHVSLGSGFAVNQALLSGRIYAGFAVPANFHDSVVGKDVRLLAVSSPSRLPEYPQVPTFAELYGAEFVRGAPHGLVTHAAAPPERVQILRDRLAEAMADPLVREKLEAAKIPPLYANAEDFGKALEREWTEIANLIKSGML